MASSRRDQLLVSTEWLASRLDDPDLRVLDVTVHLEPGPRELAIRSGRDDWAARHVPGAGFLDLVTDLADPSSGLAFTRPSLGRVEEVLGRAGVSNASRVVVYSASSVMWATRAWWLMTASGHDAVSVLDGGLRKWTAEGRPLTNAPCAYPAAIFEARERVERWASQQEVLDAIGDGAVCTVCALPRSLYTGRDGLGYARRGRISGSANVPFHLLVDRATEEIRPDAELRRHFEAVGAMERQRAITYCGGGIAATLDAFALTLAGHPNVAVYDGSIDEWSRNPDLPMETG